MAVTPELATPEDRILVIPSLSPKLQDAFSNLDFMKIEISPSNSN